MNTISFILILIVLVTFATLYFLSRKKKTFESETDEVVKGYRITFFKNGEKADSKIVR